MTVAQSQARKKTTTKRAPHVLIMAGGTGGHVFPALAVARALIAQGATVSWLGTTAGIEARLVPAEGLALHTINVAGLRGKRITTLLCAPIKVARAVWQAFGVVRRLDPQLVIGMGGFAAGPGGLAARLQGRKLLIHEQNAAPGLTNRLLARIATTVLQAFPDTFVAARHARTVGNPVRADILAIDAPDARLVGRSGPVRLLVLGGSGGALAINETIPAALALMDAADRPEVRHQAGRTLEAAQAAYAAHGMSGEVSAFIDDMAAAYSWADLVVCRSGALTVAELAAAGLPALLIPYPFAVDDHQRANGEYLVAAGAARLIDQRDASAARLADEISSLCADRDALRTQAMAARAAAWPYSTNQIVAACHDLLEAA